MKQKLHIPAPEEESYFGMEISIGLSFLIFFALAVFFLSRGEVKKTEVLVKEQGSEVQSQLKNEKALSRRFEKMSVEELSEYQWNDKDLKAVFLFGPNNAAEIACEKNIDAIRAGTLSKELTSELENTIQNRVKSAPWRCISENFLAGRLPDGALKKNAESFFLELESLSGNVEIVTTMVDYYRENRVRLKSDRFHKWLRRCGTNAYYEGALPCRRYLKTLSPKYGRDVLESLQQSLAEDDPKASDYRSAVRMLGTWARHGQPKSWKIKSTKNLPAYDIDFRIGAVMSLCRFTMSDGGKLRQQAIDELAETAEVVMRADPAVQAERWLTTCDLMFGTAYEAKGNSPVLFNRYKVEDEPSYEIRFLIDNGFCEQKAGYPTWYCAVEKWIHDDSTIREAMSASFVETRFLEFSVEDYVETIIIERKK